MISKTTLFKAIKYVLSLVSMYSCLLVGRFLYTGGFATYIIIMLFSVMLALLGYYVTRKKLDMLFLHVNLIISVYLGGCFSTKYYLSEIRGDQLSRILGNAFTQAAVVLSFVTVAVLFAVRLWKTKETR